MKKKYCYVLSLIVSVILCYPSVSFAADRKISEQKEIEKVSADSWIASGKELLGPSWDKNPKRFDSVPSPLLYQFTANYSYSGQDGNVEVEEHKGTAELILRKQLITAVTRYNTSKRTTKTALTDSSADLESEDFFQSVRYPLSDWIEAIVGGIWQINDDTKFLDKRSNYFVGALIDVIDRQDISLRIIGSYGWADMEYMNSVLTERPIYADFTPVDDYSSDNIYLKQILRLNITDAFTFTEQAELTQLLKDTDYYFWLVDFAFDFEMSKHLSLTASYTIEYDYNGFTEAAQNYLDEQRAMGKPVGEMHEIDTSFTVGIKVSF
ncbi:MAG: DUF481 domain-containing protein [Candidatus Electrothrix sp. AW1]|nr:DUF481 domain-containing protein [Candidatus Electrothrix gigas]